MIVQIDENFIRERIAQLRIKKGVSEYKMSLDLGHKKGYIQGITSGNSLPPMSEFLKICKYLKVTPAEFFNEQESQYSILIQKAIEGMQELDDQDILALISIINRLRAR